MIEEQTNPFPVESRPEPLRLSAKARKDGSSMTEAEIEAAEEEAQNWARRANSC
jgi:hypothetical protein